MEGREHINSTPQVTEIQGNEGTTDQTVQSNTKATNGHDQQHVIDIHTISSAPARPRSSTGDLFDEEAREKYLSVGVELYKAALRGDWETVKTILDGDPRLSTASISRGGQTVLHLAAGTKHVPFVENLIQSMRIEDLEVRDEKGNTALCSALGSITGQAVAEILLEKNTNLATIRGGKDMTPLFIAALFGHSEMASSLYPKTLECLDDNDRHCIFFTCIVTGLYDMALKMLKLDICLATKRDKNNKTALHLLALIPSAFDNESPEGWSKLFKSAYLHFGFERKQKQSKAAELVKFLWDHILLQGHDKAIDLISKPTKLLFEATKVGNFEFLAALIGSYPDLIWETDSQNQTIIHIAVLYRHANIFNLIHEIGSIKDDLAAKKDTESNSNILHLAAKLPCPERLNVVSGAALQMQQELLWFEEVKRIVPPHYITQKNKKKKTPNEMFTSQHKPLLSKGEEWMKSTASSCMIVATLIATVVFAAAFSLPGGNNDDHDGTPNNLKSHSFLIFVLSDGLALLNSVVAMLMFLSILVSRYSEYDFLKWLPLKLMVGLTTLFFSMVAMMIAFSFAFVLVYHHHHGLKWVPLLISLFGIVPTALFAILKFPLLLETFLSTYCSGMLFQTSRRML
ncbi:ankyrin repeat-containing protein ITN1-like isoform X2 [Humulus lupulus]|uniref:ankyrin repeat-containing protein ITN1-like isoform X2 n=1 Tax=Humulus lupulus TaxID=3486 RepID=UPI002B406967|nr:ankyrin repeat-containing protein ITN1-like isoform X2 [Humulus lupulus]